MYVVCLCLRSKCALVSFVVNVRADQLIAGGGAIRLPRFSLKAALKAAEQPVLLYASRDEELPGYIATAILGDPVPDPDHAGFYWLPLLSRASLNRRVTLKELRALGVREMPFSVYARPIRRVEEDEYQGLLDIGAIPPGFGEAESPSFMGSSDSFDSAERHEYRALRFEMLDVYGPRCVFTERSYPSLIGMHFGSDVGHLWPRSAGGPSVIRNIVPMTKDVNHQWDWGLVSLRNNGDVLIAAQAGEDTRALFAAVTRIRFPQRAELWPDALFLERHRDEIFEKGPKWTGTSSREKV
jgi:hypothetical protein